jgi:hypothetical protein
MASWLWIWCSAFPVISMIVMTDRLALATREHKAQRLTTCSVCSRPIGPGETMVRLVSPNGWCHLRCTEVVRVLAMAGQDGAGQPVESPYLRK